jgi:hypothetical protein
MKLTLLKQLADKYLVLLPFLVMRARASIARLRIWALCVGGSDSVRISTRGAQSRRDNPNVVRASMRTQHGDDEATRAPGTRRRAAEMHSSGGVRSSHVCGSDYDDDDDSESVYSWTSGEEARHVPLTARTTRSSGLDFECEHDVSRGRPGSLFADMYTSREVLLTWGFSALMESLSKTRRKCEAKRTLGQALWLSLARKSIRAWRYVSWFRLRLYAVACGSHTAWNRCICTGAIAHWRFATCVSATSRYKSAVADTQWQTVVRQRAIRAWWATTERSKALKKKLLGLGVPSGAQVVGLESLSSTMRDWRLHCADGEKQHMRALRERCAQLSERDACVYVLGVPVLSSAWCARADDMRDMHERGLHRQGEVLMMPARDMSSTRGLHLEPGHGNPARFGHDNAARCADGVCSPSSSSSPTSSTWSDVFGSVTAQYAVHGTYQRAQSQETDRQTGCVRVDGAGSASGEGCNSSADARRRALRAIAPKNDLEKASAASRVGAVHEQADLASRISAVKPALVQNLAHGRRTDAVDDGADRIDRILSKCTTETIAQELAERRALRVFVRQWYAEACASGVAKRFAYRRAMLLAGDWVDALVRHTERVRARLLVGAHVTVCVYICISKHYIHTYTHAHTVQARGVKASIRRSQSHALLQAIINEWSNWMHVVALEQALLTRRAFALFSDGLEHMNRAASAYGDAARKTLLRRRAYKCWLVIIRKRRVGNNRIGRMQVHVR